MEIWNNVFMQYNRIDANTLETLPAQCVDTGMGIERCTVTLNGMKSVYETDCFASVLARIKEIVGEGNYSERSARIIADSHYPPDCRKPRPGPLWTGLFA